MMGAEAKSWRFRNRSRRGGVLCLAEPERDSCTGVATSSIREKDRRNPPMRARETSPETDVPINPSSTYPVLIGIDLGERRVGFAVCDAEWRIASPLRTVSVRTVENARLAVREVMEETGAAWIVLGHPRNLDGRCGPAARKAEAFAAVLRAEGWRVDAWDERLTTAEAERYLREAGASRKQRTAHVDAVAAQRILDTYMQAARRDPVRYSLHPDGSRADGAEGRSSSG